MCTFCSTKSIFIFGTFGMKGIFRIYLIELKSQIDLIPIDELIN